jgi:hypothetical protein
MSNFNYSTLQGLLDCGTSRGSIKVEIGLARLSSKNSLVLSPLLYENDHFYFLLMTQPVIDDHHRTFEFKSPTSDSLPILLALHTVLISQFRGFVLLELASENYWQF